LTTVWTIRGFPSSLRNRVTAISTACASDPSRGKAGAQLRARQDAPGLPREGAQHGQRSRWQRHEQPVHQRGAAAELESAPRDG
jgi:hypothetical protein